MTNEQNTTTMTTTEAINKIEEAGFSARLWEKHGLQRIYIEFTFNHKTREGGFLGRDKTQLVAQACGHHTQKYQDILNTFAEFEIDWNSSEKVYTKTSAIHLRDAAEEDTRPEWMNDL